MKIPMYQLDAFTSNIFTGNPAAVCLLDAWLDDALIQSIATENNHSETAFLVRRAEGYELRWFTPATEVPLCGHATLASSYVVFNLLNWPRDVIRFQTRRSGVLSVIKKGDLLEMDFPSRPPSPEPTPPGLEKALNHTVLEAWGAGEDLLVLLENESSVRGLEPDIPLMMRAERRSIIATARGDSGDFVSRYFAPQVGIPEDPVTGSAHCVLTPFWAKRLGKKTLSARQVSRRGGEILCEDRGERVSISGKAVLYLEGAIRL
jgi:PhzF family phenazine biosynthesis protein